MSCFSVACNIYLMAQLFNVFKMKFKDKWLTRKHPAPLWWWSPTLNIITSWCHLLVMQWDKAHVSWFHPLAVALGTLQHIDALNEGVLALAVLGSWLHQPLFWVKFAAVSLTIFFCSLASACIFIIQFFFFVMESPCLLLLHLGLSIL